MAKPQPKTKEENSTNVVKHRQQQPAVIVDGRVPDYINQKSQRGSENVKMADLVVPRLEIVQGLSPAVKRGDPGFIQGATAGMINNSVTRQLYGEEVMVVPVHFSVQYLVWRDRKMAEQLKIGSEGGFFGAYPSQMDAQERAKQEGGEEKAIVIVDTPQHLCLILNQETGTFDEIMVSMPKTKAKISRQWNSLIKLAGGDRFGRVYKLRADYTKNAKGDYFNWHVELMGYPSEILYRQAEELYKVIAAGERHIVMDVSGMGDDAGSGEGGGEDGSREF